MQRNQDGMVVAEFVIVVTVLIAFVALLVGMGQLFHAKGEVTDAARNGAQAAVVAATSSMAVAQGQAAARATLSPIPCRALDVTVDTSRFAPGGAVAVKVSCTVNLSDAAIIGIPGSVTVTSTVSAPMESYRNA